MVVSPVNQGLDGASKLMRRQSLASSGDFTE